MPSNIVLFKQPNGLTTSLKTDTVLRSQPKSEVIKSLAFLVHRLASLYSVPDWSDMKSVDLAEWIYDNYTFELGGTIHNVLKNPPTLGKPVWRMTPDTIREWMTVELERVCDAREQEVRDWKRKEIENYPNPDLIKQVFEESEEFDKEEAKEKNKLRRLSEWIKKF